MTSTEVAYFREAVWAHYAGFARDLPWRTPALKLQPDGTLNPYKIMVSEVMLQQTQVERVRPKYKLFLARFPTVHALGDAQLNEVLKMWNGLGYNRRAKFLWQAAQAVVKEFNGHIPKTVKELDDLPGIGPGTAAAIMNYAYNIPAPFVETNIRSVYLHHFFDGADAVSDKDILATVQKTIEAEHAREWFWALMDYGTYLKKSTGSGLHRSKNYKKQSTFKGSVREMRGRIIKALLDGAMDEADLRKQVKADDRFAPALDGLKKEAIITKNGTQLRL